YLIEIFLKTDNPLENTAPNTKDSDENNPLIAKLSARQVQIEHWLELAIKGDIEAFGELYRLYVKNIHRYFLNRLTIQADCEDLTAQVFLKAWQAIGNYKISGAPFIAWLYRIAHNELINYRQAKQIKFESDAVLASYLPTDGSDNADTDGWVDLVPDE